MTESNRPDHHRIAPEPRSRAPFRGALLVALLALAAFGAWRLWAPQATAPMPPPTSAGPDTGQASGAAPAPQSPAAPLHPVASTAEPEPQEDAASQLEKALAELLGQVTLPSTLQPDNFAQRVVATVDNLGRSHAPARMWPVAPTPGRFQVRQNGDGTMSVAQDNDARYAAFVSLAESVDMARLAALYARFYPLFQRAYAEIGFPGQHFNDRLVAVIDHLLQAPRPASPVAITLVEVRSDTPAPRPWVRYEFADPALEALSAGQKLMIRVGPENRRRLEALLTGLRRHVADGALAGRPAQGAGK